MDCDRLFETLADDAPVGDPSAQGLLCRHLDSCSRCRRLHAVLQRGRAVLRSLSPISAPEDFFERLQRRIDALEAHRRTRRRRVQSAARWGAAGAAVSLAVVALLLPGAPGLLEGLRRLLDSGWTDSARSASVEVPSAGTTSSSRIISPASAGLHPFAILVGEESGVSEGPYSEVAGLPAARWAGFYRLAVTQPGPWGYTLRPAAGAMQPVLYTTPSLSFTASPVSFGFVAAHVRNYAQADVP